MTMAITTEITVKPQAFRDAVAWAAKWVAAKPVIPIQGGLMLSVVANGLTISAYNDSASVRTTLECAPHADEPGSAVVSGRLLAALASTLTTRTPVTLVSSEDGTALIMRQGKFVATLPAMDETTWSAPGDRLEVVGTIDGSVLAAAVARVGVATPADVDKSGAVLAAMLVDFGADGNVEIMASDKYRVARVVVSWKSTASGVTITPLGSMMLTAAAAFDGPDDIEIGASVTQFSLSSPTRSMTLNTIDTQGQWPVELFHKAFDDPRPQTAIIEPAELITPLKRASIVRGKGGPIAIRFSTGALTVDAFVVDSNQASDDEVTIDYAGPDLEVGFNPDYFADALESAPGPKVLLRFGIDRKHVILTSSDDPSWRHVLMPVLLTR